MKEHERSTYVRGTKRIKHRVVICIRTSDTTLSLSGTIYVRRCVLSNSSIGIYTYVSTDIAHSYCYQWFDLGTYSTAQFKVYTRMQAHACACMFNTCKTSKTGVCMHCYTQFWRAHMGQ